MWDAEPHADRQPKGTGTGMARGERPDDRRRVRRLLGLEVPLQRGAAPSAGRETRSRASVGSLAG